MDELKIDVNIVDIGTFDELMSALIEHYDDLPEEVREVLDDVSY